MITLDAHDVRRWTVAALLTVLAGGLLTACIGAPGTRAGGEPPPITLRMGTDDPAGRPASNQIEQFAREVELRSDGRLRILPVFQAAGMNQSDWDQKVARLVVSGELDMGMVPARAWDTDGVTTLRPLNAPFLIDSDERLEAIVSDDDLSGDLMAGLDSVGVTGLALLPEGLRHLFMFDRQDITQADFGGARIRSPRSDTTWALLAALGATPTDDPFDETVRGAESEFALAATLPRTSAVIGNLTLFPKVNSLVVNGERFAELEPEHQQALRDAALATRDWAIDLLPHDAELAAAFCDAGDTVLLAGEAELDQIRTAARPVMDVLRKDAETAGLIDRVSTLTSQVGTSRPVRACSAGPADGSPAGRSPGAVSRPGPAIPQ